MIASMGHAGRFPRTGNRGKRSGANIGNTREIWPCADGFVSFGLRGGRARVANLQTITRLVDEDGLATPALTDRDWTTYDHTKMTPRGARGDLRTDRGVLRAPQDGGALRDRVRDEPDARSGRTRRASSSRASSSQSATSSAPSKGSAPSRGLSSMYESR